MDRLRESFAVASAAVLLTAAGAAAATADQEAPPAAREPRAPLLDVPYIPQPQDLCGGAAAAMVLRYWGEPDVHPGDFAHLVDRSEAGIRTSVLEAALRERGWQTYPFAAGPAWREDVGRHLERGRPLVALIEDAPGVYHYVVIVGLAGEHIVAHDPARAPFRVLSPEAFERAWAPSDRWALLVLPPPAGTSGPPLSGGISTSAEPAPLPPACGGLVEESIARAHAGDTAAAEEGLRAAIDLCPADAAPWRELAGLRFLDADWPAAVVLAAHAAGLDAEDEYAWTLLGTAHFMAGTPDAALSAWNRAGRPRIDLLHISGARRTRQPVIADLLDLPFRELLTAGDLRQARRRLQELPAAASALVTYRPLGSGLADVHAVVDERTMLPRGRLPAAALAIRTALRREARLEAASLTGSGELWSAAWRWWESRPRVEGALAIPAPAPLPGVARVEALWERQSYAVAGRGAAEPFRSSRRRAGLSLSDWATGNLRWQAGGALDGWSARRHVALEAALDLRRAGDRLSLGIEASRWMPLGAGEAFHRTGLSAAWRSRAGETPAAWTATAGLIAAGEHAPPDLWPGAGIGHARAPLLRAHPLLRRGVIDGAVFGRRLAHATMEHQRPAPGGGGVLRLALFADAARAWSLPDGTPSSPLHLDVGAGLRAAAPGPAGGVRLDVARGLRDGGLVLSAAWQPRWPGR